MSLLSRSPLDITNAMWDADSFATPPANHTMQTGTLQDFDHDAFTTWNFTTWNVTSADNEIMTGGSDKGFAVSPASGYTVVMKIDPLPSNVGQVPFGPDGLITLNPGDSLVLNKCPAESSDCTMKFYYTPAGGSEVETAESHFEHNIDLISVTKADNGSGNGGNGGTDDDEDEDADLVCTDPNAEPNVDSTECVCKSGFAQDEDEDSDTFGTCIESGMSTTTKLAIALGGVVLLGGGIWYAVKSQLEKIMVIQYGYEKYGIDCWNIQWIVHHGQVHYGRCEQR